MVSDLPEATKLNIRKGKSNKHRRNNARCAGMSLLTVTVLGVCVMMWLYAVSASVLPMYWRAAGSKYTAISRSAVEAGLDWAVAQLNSSISGNAITSNLIGGAWNAVPTTAVGNSGAAVSVKVVQVSPPATSAIFESFSNPAQWFVLTGKADYAGMERKIRVVLAPYYLSGSGLNPYFQFGMFGQKSINLSGNATTDGYNYGSSVSNPYGGANIDTLGGNIGTNANPMPSSGAAATLSGGAKIGGSLLIYQSGTSTLATGSGSATINGQLIDNGLGGNGNSTGFSSANVMNAGASTSPVRNLGGVTAPAIVNAASGLPSGSNILSGSSVTPPPAAPLGNGTYNLPPPQSVPAGATVVSPAISQSGSGGNAVYTVAPPAAGTVVNLSAFSQSGNVVWNLPPGDYEMSSLSTSGNGQINLVAGSNGQYGPVRFFVGGNSSSNAVQISGNGIVNNSSVPGNFQIWYGGSQNVQLSGNASLYGTLYAPKASVSITGNGSIYGAVVGYTINDSGNGAVHFDQSLANPNNQWATYGATTLSGLQTITWQEPQNFHDALNW